METATAGGGGEDADTNTHTDTHRAIRGWGDGAGGHARPRGKSWFVVMFFLPRPLHQLVFLTLSKPQGRASDAFLSFSFDVSVFVTVNV